MDAQAEKFKVSRGRAILIGVLLACIYVLPILVYLLSGGRIREFFWKSPVDISMLEWTGAFFSVFMFLLLIEYFRSTSELVYGIMACGFLFMGLLDFTYALNFPGTEQAAWLKYFAVTSAALFFSISLRHEGRTRWDFDFLHLALKFIVPTLAAAWLLVWIPGRLGAALPAMLGADGASVSASGKFLFWISGALLFVVATCWLYRHMLTGRRESMVFAMMAYMFALSAFMARFGKSWGFLWWAWHLLIVATLSVATVYMLGVCMRRSLVWRLLMSLGLVFGVAILISAGIMQGLIQRLDEVGFQRLIYSKHLRLICFESAKLSFAVQNLKNMKERAETDLGGLTLNLSQELFRLKMQATLDRMHEDWPEVIRETCFLADGEFWVSSKSVLDDLKKEKLRKLEAGLDAPAAPPRKMRMPYRWGEIFCDNASGRWLAPVAMKSDVAGRKGIFTYFIDVSSLKTRSLGSWKQPMAPQEGRLILERESKEVISAVLPKACMDSFPGLDPAKTPLVSFIRPAILDSDEEARTLGISSGGRKYLVFTSFLPCPGWVVADIIDYEAMAESSAGQAKYFHTGAGMIALLGGFIVLLLLLNYQLARPLKKLLTATERLESGDFTVKINSGLGNELGTLSNAFDNMVIRLHDMYESLQKTVQERTRALEEVEKASSARTVFFTRLSHELRTPLHGILSFSRLGLGAPDAPKEKLASYFQSINDCGQRLLKIINEMLDIAKIKSGQMDFSFVQASLYITAMQVYGELRASFEEKGVRFVCDEPAFSTSACFDRDKITRVLRNILWNAWKFSPPGGTISVEFSAGDGTVGISISDEGPGIPEQELENIFTEFFQSKTGKAHEGTGLGLAICRDIIKCHNGTIYATNRPGKRGAVFTFRLPVEQRKQA